MVTHKHNEHTHKHNKHRHINRCIHTHKHAHTHTHTPNKLAHTHTHSHLPNAHAHTHTFTETVKSEFQKQTKDFTKLSNFKSRCQSRSINDSLKTPHLRVRGDVVDADRQISILGVAQRQVKAMVVHGAAGGEQTPTLDIVHAAKQTVKCLDLHHPRWKYSMGNLGCSTREESLSQSNY